MSLIGLVAVRQRVPSLSRRSLSTTAGNANVGKIVRRKRPSGRPGGASPNSPNASPSEKTVMSPDIRRNNVLLGVTLVCSVASIVMYSMTAVGQAGTPQDGGEDPLETLKREAAQAQDKKDKEAQDIQDTQAMIDKVKSGVYDPDNYDDLEAESAEDEKKKKPWWKFW